MPLTPKNRKEEWLQGLVDHETTLTPKNRPEEWMKGLIEGSTTLTPKNRCEEWMKEIIDASGGGRLETLFEDDIEVSTTSTSSETVATYEIPGLYDMIVDGSKIVLITITDNEGLRANYYFGSIHTAWGTTNTSGSSYYGKADGSIGYSSSANGIYPSISSSAFTVKARYNSVFGTLDGTFKVCVYTLDPHFDI